MERGKKRGLTRGSRFNFMKSKKAIAPLIATVLLIAFAVALGAIVMNWGRAYVEDTASLAQKSSSGQVECTNDVDLQINKVLYSSEDDDLEDEGLSIVVENLKNKKLLGLSIKVLDENGNGFVTPLTDNLNDLKSEDSTSQLKPFQIRRIYVNASLFQEFREDMLENDPDYNPTALKEIRVIPYILPDDDMDLDVIACDGRAKTTKFGEDAWPDDKINFTSS